MTRGRNSIFQSPHAPPTIGGMLATFTLTALVGLGLFAYFRPLPCGTETFNFTRRALVFAMLAYAASSVTLKMVAAGGERDAMALVILFEAAGWIALAIGLKEMFVILASRPPSQSSSTPD